MGRRGGGFLQGQADSYCRGLWSGRHHRPHHPAHRAGPAQVHSRQSPDRGPEQVGRRQRAGGQHGVQQRAQGRHRDGGHQQQPRDEAGPRRGGDQVRRQKVQLGGERVPGQLRVRGAARCRREHLRRGGEDQEAAHRVELRQGRPVPPGADLLQRDLRQQLQGGHGIPQRRRAASWR